MTGFDGMPLSRIARPALTTACRPIRQLSERAVESLVGRLGDATREPASPMLPVSPVRRASRGCG